MLYIENRNTDPYYNLSLEEYIFNTVKEDVFILWQNSPTIVVGKYQNTMEEISGEYVKKHSVKVVRRMSGGGAVYHDLGNVNFTFIVGQNKENTFNFDYFTRYILEILAEYQIKAEYNSRNDLVINGRKFSGNSQYIKKGKMLHHGTLLFNSDLNVLAQALNVDDIKIESKAIKSIHERVTNISEHLATPKSVEEFKGDIKRYICRNTGAKEYDITDEEKAEIYLLRKNKYLSWSWNYGESPKCNIVKRKRLEGLGVVEIKLSVENGYIKACKIQGDFFADENFPKAERLMVGCQYSENGISKGVEKISGTILGMDKQWLSNFILL